MEGKRACSTCKWLAIKVIEPGKEDDVYPLDAKEKHLRKFKRASRRVFPKDINSSIPKEKIVQAFKKLDKSQPFVPHPSKTPSSLPQPKDQPAPPPEEKVVAAPETTTKLEDTFSFSPEVNISDLESETQAYNQPEISFLGEEIFPSSFNPLDLFSDEGYETNLYSSLI